MSLLTIPHSWLWLCHADSKRDRNEPNANGLLPSTNEVWGKVIFLSVIPSVNGGGGLASQHASQVTWLGGLHRGGRLGRPPSPSDTMGYGQQPGSTHPIGMHSCNCVNVHTSSRQVTWTHFSSEIVLRWCTATGCQRPVPVLECMLHVNVSPKYEVHMHASHLLEKYMFVGSVRQAHRSYVATWQPGANAVYVVCVSRESLNLSECASTFDVHPVSCIMFPIHGITIPWQHVMDLLPFSRFQLPGHMSPRMHLVKYACNVICNVIKH